RDRLAAPGCALSFHAEPRVQGIWDRRRVEQLLTNLLGSAIRHGSGQPIAVDLVADADSARTSVRFQGQPLSASEDEERLFEEEPAAGDTGVRHGTGASTPGLWSARDVAAVMGGTIQIAEAEGARGLT